VIYPDGLPKDKKLREVYIDFSNVHDDEPRPSFMVDSATKSYERLSGVDTDEVLVIISL